MPFHFRHFRVPLCGLALGAGLTFLTPLEPADAGGAAQTVPAQSPLMAKALALHERAIVVDGHNDIPMWVVDRGFDLAQKGAKTHTDLARIRAGGLTGTFFSVYVDDQFVEKPTAMTGGATRRALDFFDAIYLQVERHPESLMLATTAADVRKAKAEGKMAVLIGIEGAQALENSLGALRCMYRLGARYMTLTHSFHNDLADSAGIFKPEPPRHHGLTPFGLEAVQEMQRMGMLVDISHVSDETFWQVLKVAKAPVIASHSSARALADIPRNLDDRMIKAVADNGGVVMVNFFSGFLDVRFAKEAGARWDILRPKYAELREKYKDDPATLEKEVQKLRDAHPIKPVPLDTLIDHLMHMVKVAGADHVGLGSDFDGIGDLPDGLGGVDGLPKITYQLLKRGLSEEDVLKILGGNILRVMEAAEAYAASTRSTLSGDGSVKRIDQLNKDLK